MTAATRTLGEQALTEVEAAHAFFADWFTGRIRDRAVLEARLAAFDPAFVRISPEGKIVTAADLAALLDRRRLEEDAAFSIAIEDAGAKGIIESLEGGPPKAVGFLVNCPVVYRVN